MDGELGVMGAVGLLLLGILFNVTMYFLGKRCSACKRWQAMEKTGRTQSTDINRHGKQEWLCKYCKHRVWRDFGGG